MLQWCKFDNKKLIEFGAKISLKDIGAKADTQGKPKHYPLLYASGYGCTNILKFLIKMVQTSG